MTIKSKANRSTQRNRTFSLNPTTRAIRHVLALGLVMAAAQPAFAGTCDVSIPSNAVCDGDFIGSNISYTIDDLTIVVGGELPTVIQPLDGYAGIDLYAAAGSITLTSAADILTSHAAAISVYAPDGDVNVENSGSLESSYATGIEAVSYLGDVTVINDGSILALGTLGIEAVSHGGNVAVANTAGASIAVENANGNAIGIYASSYDGDIAIDNQTSGSITAAANDGAAIGIDAIAGYGSSVTITNDGSIEANTTGDYAAGVHAEVQGYTVYPSYSGVTVNNTGSISADAQLDYGYVRVNGVAGVGENVTINNDGVISATGSVELGNSVVVAAYSVANTFSTLTNGVDGSITAVATSGQGYEYVTDAFAYGAFVAGSTALISNYGSISAEATVYGGQAIVASVGATTYAGYGFATIVNYGDISAVAVAASTEASYAFAYGTNTHPSYTAFSMAATTANGGDISADATVFIGNAVSNGVTTAGKYAATYNYEGATISATSTAESRGRADAVGVSTYGAYYAHDVNHGSITAYAVAHGIIEDGRFTYGAANATGVEELSSPLGASSLVNYGGIAATAIAVDSDSFFLAGARAVGVDQFGKYSADIANHGDISATASAELGIVSAYGTYQSAKYGYTTSLDNHEGASIVATAASGSASDDYAGGRAAAIGALQKGGSYAVEYNSGLISASATVDPHGREFTDNPSQAYAVGSMQTGYYGATLKNYGDIQAVASADSGYATAYGAKVMGAYFSETHNEGGISAVASADNGNAFAVGSYTLAPAVSTYEGCTPDWSVCYYSYAGGTVSNDNLGQISAASRANSGMAYAYGSVAISRLRTDTTNSGSITAVANAEHGTSIAAGSISNGVYGIATLDNTGTIVAAASGDDASATGAIVVGSYGDVDSGYYAASVTNAGSITALADGIYASTATGLEATGRYTDGVNVLNDVGGEISAAAYGVDATATAVSLTSNGNNTLVNRGSILAIATGTNAAHIAVSSSDGAAATLDNYGSIQGSILTGSLDDTLVNHAGATLVLGDDTIDLGAHAGVGNAFANEGTIVVRGASNRIDMGQGLYTAVPSLNPLAFDNVGVIDFVDGAADDLLTITGDFAGDGQINVDVSALHGASDMLYIDGSVVDGSTHTINVNWLDLPTATSSAISVVSVTGDSTAASFVLGNVATNAGFLTLDFNLLSTIDASNATADVFSLGVEVTGLSDAGVLAASIAPGAQSLMSAQVGTWRQRMGLISQYARNGVGAWARVFQNQGTIAPELAASSFGDGGHFAFDQKNAGTEVGVDFALSEEFSVGLLLAKAEGTQHLNAGAGSSKLKGDTSGVYATWISPNGFYFDGSYRAMDVTAKMSSAAGELQAEGDAGTLNFEAGYAWTLQGGLKIEPQLQYTQTHVSSDAAVTIGQDAFRVADGDASTGRLGVMLRKSFGTGTVWTPYASLNVVHEFDGKSAYSINDDFFGATSTDGTSALIEGGVNVQVGKLSVFGGFNWQDGGAVQSFGGGQLGVRYTW